jgi:predicted transcriptional regulator
MINDSSPIIAALMSIRPQYVKAIVSGDKLIEFRKKSFKKAIKYILVYETAPAKTIAGYIEVKNIEIGTPSDIWKKYSDIGTMTKKDFFNYYINSEVAVGILINKFVPFINPLDIKELEIFPPQSFSYVSFDLFDKIKNIEFHPHA